MKSKQPKCLSAAAALAACTFLPSTAAFSGALFLPITNHLRTTSSCCAPSHHHHRCDHMVLRMSLDNEETDDTSMSGNSSSSTSTATAAPESSTWTIGSPSPKIAEEARKKLVAKEALTKLLERQQQDLQQTLDLIANLDLEEDNNTGNDQSTSLSSEPNSIAASIASAADYGFTSRSEGCRVPYNKHDTNNLNNIDERFQEYGPPTNIFSIGGQQFMRNLRAIFNEYSFDEGEDPKLTPRQVELQAQLSTLTLDSEAIWEREHARGPITAPWIIKAPYYVLCFLLDVVFEGRNPFQRFFLLETVARMPYFSYMTMLHAYETLGFWRRSADIKRIHFAEEWNEFHHLLIQESLGGDQPFYVRFMAQHSAVVYYIVLCLLWMASPSLSYKFSEMLETHAVDTYGQFVDENEAKLKELPPSLIAVEYYTVGLSDPMFGEYQTKHGTNGGNRELHKSGMSMTSLYDVFVAIRNDEGEHVNTMQSCLDPTAPTLSQGLEGRVLTAVALSAATSYLFGNYPGFDSLNGFMDSLTTVTAGGGDVAMDGLTELDQILAESSGDSSEIMNSIVGGLTGLANRLNDLNSEGVGVEVTEAVEVEVDENTITDVAGSALEDVVSGLEGIELEVIIDAVRNVIIAILELIPFL